MNTATNNSFSTQQLLSARADAVNAALQKMNLHIKLKPTDLHQAAFVTYQYNGNRIVIEFRSPGSSTLNILEVRYSNGSVSFYYTAKNYRKETVEHRVNDTLHSVDGPARITYADTYIQEETYQQGTLHNTQGPAIVRKRFDGTIFKKEYYAHGTKLPGQAGAAVTNPNTRPQTITKHATGPNPHIAYVAAQHPNCPEEAKIAYNLIHPQSPF